MSELSANAPAKHLVVIGLGGTGSALLPLLVLQPIDSITLVDGDTVEAVNLVRQPLYTPADVGRLKVEAAAERVRPMAGLCILHVEPYFLAGANAHELLCQASLVVDCTDDLHARRAIDRACSELGTPLITAAVHGHQVQVLTLHVALDDGPASSWADWFPGRTTTDQDNCDMRTVPVEVTTMAATLIARRVRALMAGDRGDVPWMDLLDLREGRWMRIGRPRPWDEGELIADKGTGNTAT
jgi:adenylyltransferase/sulfurtransferase